MPLLYCKETFSLQASAAVGQIEGAVINLFKLAWCEVNGGGGGGGVCVGVLLHEGG